MPDKLINKQVYTTGEAAKICKVSQQTIIRCFDNGRLQGFKVPGSRFRRIPHAELLRFMRSNGIDATTMELGPRHILVVGVPSPEINSVIESHADGKNIQIHHTNSTWEAGYLTHKHNPGLILCHEDFFQSTNLSVQKLFNNKEKPIVIKVANYKNTLNLGINNSDSNKEIINAVNNLLTA